MEFTTKAKSERKILAAAAVLMMVVCALAFIVPSTDASGDATPITPDSTISYGSAVEMNQTVWEGLVKDNVVKLEEDQTWNLTENVTEDNATIDLNGHNLKITGKFTLSVTYAGTDASGALVSSNGTDAGNLCIDGSTVTLIGAGTRSGGAFSVEAMNIGQVMIQNGAVLNVQKAENASGVGTLWHTDAKSLSSVPHVEDNNCVIFVKDSTINFENKKEDAAGVQVTAIVATDSTINSTLGGVGTLAVYAQLNNSTIKGDRVGLYSADLNGTSKIEATELGIYSNVAPSAYSGFTLNTVDIDANSAITASTKIINSLSNGTSRGEMSATITGTGTISGSFQQATASAKAGEAAYYYKISGVSIGKSSLSTTALVQGVTFSDTFTVNNNGVLTIPKGATVSGGDKVTISSGIVYNLGNASITGATTELPEDAQEVDSGSALVDKIETGYTKVKITGDVTLPAGSNLDVAAGTTLDLNGKTVTVAAGDDVTLNGTVTGTEGTIAISGESVVNASLKSENGMSFIVKTTDATGNESSIKFTDLKSGEFSVTVGSVELAGTIQGNIEITGTQRVSSDCIVNGTITVNSNAIINIDESVTLSADSIVAAGGASNITINLRGSITGLANKISLNNAFTVNVYGSGSLNNVKADKVVYQTEDSQFQFKGKMDQNITVSTEQSLTGDLYIPSGYTLTVAAGGVLNLNGYGIYVEGTLQVDSNGSIKNFGTATTSDNQYGNKIILYRNGQIVNNGVIGSGSEVTVTAVIPTQTTWNSPAISVPTGYTGSGSVVMKDVTGVSFGVVRDEGSKYILGISGSVSIFGMSGYSTVTADGVVVTDTLEIGRDVQFAADGVEVQRNVEVTLEGKTTITGTGLTMTNGSTVTVYGQVSGVITAETGTFGANQSATGTTTVNLSAGTNPVTNVVLTVGQYAYVDENGNAMTDQRLYISGTVGYVGDADDNGTIAIVNNNGLAYVAEDAVLALGNVKLTSGGLVVLGQIQYTGNASNVSNDLTGVKYTLVDAADRTKRTYYVAAFDDAFGIIDTVYNKTLTVYGGYTVKGELELLDDQTLIFSGSQFNIAETGEFTVQNGASVTTTSQATVQKVEGVLTVMSGGVCPTPKEYAVMKTGTDFVQYSGLVPAINNAQPGDVINVVNNATVSNDMTIGNEVTVSIDDGVVMTFMKNLTVQTGGKIVNNGTIQMAGEKSTITVEGTLDSSEGTVKFVKIAQGQTVAQATDVSDNTDKGSRSIVSTGTMTVQNITDILAFINGAYYTNEDNAVVLTSFANANTAVSAQDANKSITLTGVFTERGDIALGAGVNVTVASGAKVTLGSVSFATAGAVAQTITVTGTLTAEISGTTGVGETTAQSTVSLDRASGITLSAKTNTLATGETTAYLFVGGTVSGAVTVSAGTVNVATDGLTVDGKDNTLTVAENAVLAVAKIGNDVATLTAGQGENGAASVIVNGTIAFNGGALDNASRVSGNPSASTPIDTVMTVNGTMTVGDETDVTVDGTLNIVGSLTVSTTADKEGSLIVDGVLAVGVKPTALGTAAGAGAVSGAVDLADKAYIKAYNGADLSAALIAYDAGESQADSTAFVINGWTYMTVYAETGVTYKTVLGNSAAPVEKFEIAGYVLSSTVTGSEFSINNVEDWSIDADLTQAAEDKSIGTNTELYFKANSAIVEFNTSYGQGISLYIDGIRVTGNTMKLAVGEHTVSAQVNPGYSGTVTITFNGQTVTDGKFVVTAEMASAAYDGQKVIAVTGDVTQDSTVVVNGDNGDSGMGLTDYLLIVLVVLIVIMAIIVAMRLMRS